MAIDDLRSRPSSAPIGTGEKALNDSDQRTIEFLMAQCARKFFTNNGSAQ